MEIGVITSRNIGVFRSLLLPECARAVAAEEPIVALGLTQDKLAVGACAGTLVGKHFQILSFFVASSYRRMGGGRMMMEKLKELTREDADGLKISFTTTKEEHQAIIPFLEKMGFTREEDYGETIYQTTLEQVTRTPFFEKRTGGWGTPFARLSDSVLSAGERAAIAAQAPMPRGGLRASIVDRDVSVAYLQDGAVQAYVVGDTGWSGGLNLSAAWSGSPDPMVLPGLLRSALNLAVEKYPLETALIIQVVNEKSAALISTLLPEARPISHSYFCWLTD